MMNVFKKCLRKEFGKKGYEHYVDLFNEEVKNYANIKNDIESKKIYKDMYEVLSKDPKKVTTEKLENLSCTLYKALQIARKFTGVLSAYVVGNIVLLALNLDYYLSEPPQAAAVPVAAMPAQTAAPAAPAVRPFVAAPVQPAPQPFMSTPAAPVEPVAAPAVEKEPAPAPAAEPKAAVPDIPESPAPADEELPPPPDEPPVTESAPLPWDEPTAPVTAPVPPVPEERPVEPAAPVSPAAPTPEYTADPALSRPRKVAAEGINPFEQWSEVVKLLQEKDPMLHSYLRKSKAYFDGTRVLIDGGKTFRDFIRVNKDSQRLIKKLIAQVSGVAVPIGPYEPRTAAKHTSNAEQSLHALEKLGLDVSIEDSAKKKKINNNF